ncbi:hypothetical protein Rs2_41371 [Raphanus sativus]|nr:hypothetical protein Rs2_41371 [Raphanus sativus]
MTPPAVFAAVSAVAPVFVVPAVSADAAVSAAAAVPYTIFGSLRLGRTAQSLVGRLIRFWDAKDIDKNGELLGITFLLLDEKDSVIHGFIPANRVSHYRSSLVSGSIVRLECFEVARVSHMYKVTEHQFVIRFLPSTRMVGDQVVGPVIKTNGFMVRRIGHLQVLANTNLELPDVVGEIRSVQGSDLENNADTSRILVCLLIEPAVTVYVSLRDDAASSFRGFLKVADSSQSVMLVTSVSPKLFGGNLYLNSTQGTRFFFDTSLPEIAEFVSSIGATAAQGYTYVTQEHLESFPPHVEENVGLAASSSGPAMLGNKMDEECASDTPPGESDAQKKRKSGGSE